MNDKSYDADENRFQEHRRQHPSATRAQFHMESVAGKLKQGHTHHSLGANLNSGEFWQAGTAKAAKYMRMSSAAHRSRVIDYGCGSLRIGAHFIRYLDPGCFFGLDVTDEFYEIGKRLVGDALLREKTPRFDVIGDAAVNVAANFGADLVYSNAVCYQVHPEELETYFDNLTRLANRPKAQLIFNCMTADKEVRYSHRSWARPLEVYKKGLSELELVEAQKSREIVKGSQVVTPMVLRFRRGGHSMRDRARGWQSVLFPTSPANRS